VQKFKGTLVEVIEGFLFPEGVSNQKGPLWVSRGVPREEQQTRKGLDEVVNLLNELEDSKRILEAELSKEKKLRKSLQEDLRQFSTFEQICNSGILRNFKIDAEGTTGQTILRMMLRTMELQLSHLGDTPENEAPAEEGEDSQPLRAAS